MTRLLVLLVSLAACARTGLDEDDAGSPDAGLPDAGAAACAVAADCPAVSATAGCWSDGTPAARSCVGGHCVFDCAGARTCTTAGCTTCAGERCSQCDGLPDAVFGGRLYRSCDASAIEPVGGFSATTTSCIAQVTTDAGVSLVVDGRGAGSGSTTAPGDEHCSLTVLATALYRVELGCGRCVYLLEWP